MQMPHDSQVLPRGFCPRESGVKPALDGMPVHRHAPTRVLLTATLRWAVAARLAMVFADLGCRVEAVCPRQHPVTRIRGLHRVHTHSLLRPLAALRAAIESATPDLIIPCDDNAAVQLTRLYQSTGPTSAGVRALLMRSLGTPEACALATARGRLMALAAQEGIRIPATEVVATQAGLQAWLLQHGLPAVIKIDATWGGQGVAIVHGEDEARRVFDAMAAGPSVLDAAARMLLDRDPTQLVNLLKPERPTVTLQDFIHGTPANRAVACWQGRVLGGTSVAAVETQHLTGPATVVRVIENVEMNAAVTRLVARLHLSGLWGVDFVLEESTGAAFLIEMNPRATPICHLPLGPGHDLLAALCAQLSGTPPAWRESIEQEVVALFPGEWRRHPASPYLSSAHHDIPWDEPELVRDGVDRPWSERGFIARFWAALRRTWRRRAGAGASSVHAETEGSRNQLTEPGALH